MADQIPAVPSTVGGNLSGTLAGVAATVATGFLANAGYLAIVATATGLPVATVSIIVVALVGGVVNYSVTHVAGIKKINDLYAALPTTYQEYPKDSGSQLNGG